MRKILFLFLLFLFLNGGERIVGIVKPIYYGEIGMLVDGIVDSIVVKEGDRVRRGSVILRLNSNLQQLQMQRRKLIYDDYTRIDTLKKSLVIMKKILNSKESLYNTTKAVSLNEVNRLKMKYIKSSGKLESLQIEKKKEEIEYIIAKKMLYDYTLRSPVDGVIVKIKPKIGEWVQKGDKLVSVVDAKRCFVEIDLDKKIYKKVSLNDKVTVEVDIGDKVIKKVGNVEFISSIADSSSQLIRAKVYFDNKDGSVIPGTTAAVVIE